MDKHGVGKPQATTLAAKDCEIRTEFTYEYPRTHKKQEMIVYLSMYADVYTCLHTQYTHMYELIGCTCIGGTSDGALDIEHR